MTRFVLLATVASLMAAPSIASGKEPVLSADRLRADVEFLADDLLEGRLPGTSGYDLAAAYVATRFSAMGLRPANPDGSWYQQMPFAEFAINADKPNELLVGTTRFAMGDGVVMRPTPRWGDKTRTTTAGAVFVGYGTDSDYAGLEVAGKIVIVLPDVPESLKGEARNKALSEDKAEVAKRHGARGMFSIYRAETQADKDVWRASADAMTKARQIWLTPQGEVAGPKPPLEVTAFVNGAVVDALFKGARMSAQQMFAAVDRGDMVRGFALASPVTLVHTDRVTVKTAPNVVGVLPGSDPALASEYVVLSAHLDHLGRDPDLKGDQIYNGAMDNATGVAAMLEVARAFTESEKRPKRSIMFVALTAEEKGLWGSNFLASYPIKGRENVVADVNLDMPILLYDFSDIVAFGAEHSTLGRIVDRAARQAGIALSPDPLPEEHLFERSDHYSFVKKGIPSIYLVTGFQKGGEKAFRSFLSTNYHKVTDDIRQPINWQAGAKFARINYLIARGITDAKQAPMWYQGSRYADLFAPNAPRARVLKETKPQ